MNEHFERQPATIVNVDVRPKPGVSVDTLRKRVASIEGLMSRVHQGQHYSAVDRIEAGPAGRTPRPRVILNHLATERDVYMVSGGVRSFLTADPALRRGVLARLDEGSDA